MRIGIDASRAFVRDRTGIEEYSHRVVKYLLNNLNDHEVIVYLKKDGVVNSGIKKIKYRKNIKIKVIKFHRFWTQIGLAMDILFDPVDVLFIPAHTIPWIHPKNTVVTIHGLEYEHCPESYSLYSRIMHRFFIRKSCRWAKNIIAVSQKTKKDLVTMYKVTTNKIRVIYNGFNKQSLKNSIHIPLGKNNGFVLYIGRLERRKNIKGIIGAFEILKERYGYQGGLLLVGRPGYGYEEIKARIRQSKFGKEIVEKGFVSEEEKKKLLKKADLFLFPSFSEGFGIPILEAQSAGLPVVTSNYGPMDEVAGNGNVLVDPRKTTEIALLANKLMVDEKFRKAVIVRGLENIRRFSWEDCGERTRNVILSTK